MQWLLKLAGGILSILLLTVVGFYFWASSGTYPKDQYAEVQRFGVPDAEVDDDRVFTIVTYNIGYLSGLTNNLAVDRDRQLFDQNLETAVAALASLDADFVGLQEIDLDSKRSFNVNQVTTIAQKLGFSQGAIAVNWDKRYLPFPYWPPTAHFGRTVSGQAILSRYPIGDHQRIVLERVAGKPFFYNAFYLDRVAQVTHIEVFDQPLVIINVHLEAFDVPTRRRQTQAVLELYNRYASDYPTLMIGDFNSSPYGWDTPDPTLNVLLNAPNLEPVFPSNVLQDSTINTFPSDRPTVKLDYIFYNSNQIERVDWAVVEEAQQASDHLPVMMRFRFRSEGTAF